MNQNLEIVFHEIKPFCSSFHPVVSRQTNISFMPVFVTSNLPFTLCVIVTLIRNKVTVVLCELYPSELVQSWLWLLLTVER